MKSDHTIALLRTSVRNATLRKACFFLLMSSSLPLSAHDFSRGPVGDYPPTAEEECEDRGGCCQPPDPDEDARCGGDPKDCAAEEASSAMAGDDAPVCQETNMCELGENNGEGSCVFLQAGDPVNVRNGALMLRYTDLVDTGFFSLKFKRTYNSRHAYLGQLGYGWSHNYNYRLFTYSEDGGSHVIIRRGDGQTSRFDLVAGSYEPESAEKRNTASKLEALTGSYSFRYTNYTSRKVYYFDLQGRLSKVVGPSGYEHRVSYKSNGYFNGRYPVKVASFPYAVSGTQQAIVGLEYQIDTIEEYRIRRDGSSTGAAEPTGVSLTFVYHNEADTAGCAFGSSTAASGLICKVTSSTGENTDYAYDDRGRMTKVLYSDPVDSAHTYFWEYLYEESRSMGAIPGTFPPGINTEPFKYRITAFSPPRFPCTGSQCADARMVEVAYTTSAQVDYQDLPNEVASLPGGQSASGKIRVNFSYGTNTASISTDFRTNTLTGGSSTTLRSESFTFDPVSGQVTLYSDAANNDTAFRYDAQGRLSGRCVLSGGLSGTYSGSTACSSKANSVYGMEIIDRASPEGNGGTAYWAATFFDRNAARSYIAQRTAAYSPLRGALLPLGRSSTLTENGTTRSASHFYNYDSNGFILSEEWTVPRGFGDNDLVARRIFDNEGRLVKYESLNGGCAPKLFTYYDDQVPDARHQLLSDGRNIFEYDGHGRVDAVTSTLGRRTAFSYGRRIPDSSGSDYELAEILTPSHEIDYAYHSSDVERPVSVQIKDRSTGTDYVVNYTTQLAGTQGLLSASSPRWIVKAVTQDRDRSSATQVDLLQIDYDTWGNALRMRSFAGGTSSVQGALVYDRRGLPTGFKYTAHTGTSPDRTLDWVRSNPMGFVTQIKDRISQPTPTTNGYVTDMLPDAFGKPLSIVENGTGSNLRNAAFDYDLHGLASAVQDPNAGLTTISRTLSGALDGYDYPDEAANPDPDILSLQASRDARDRISSVELESTGDVVQLDYQDAVDPSGNTCLETSRIEQVTCDNGASSQSVTVERNKVGQVTAVSESPDQDLDVTYGYHGQGSFTTSYPTDTLVQESWGTYLNKKLDYIYDFLLGSVTQIKISEVGGSEIARWDYTYAYDGTTAHNTLERPRLITLTAGAYSATVNLRYDATTGLLTGLSADDGGTASADAALTYDSLGLRRVEGIEWQYNASTIWEGLFSRRPDGLVSGANLYDNGSGTPYQSITYSYDQLMRLTGGASTSYAYDSNGNITNKNSAGGWTVDARTSRTTASPGFTYDFDDDGNLVTMSQSGVRTTTFVWDPCRRQLAAAVMDNASGNDTKAEYNYDYQNRRVGKRVCADWSIAGSSCTGGWAETRFLWSGDRLIAEMGVSGNVTILYTWMGNAPVLMTDVGAGKSYALLGDHLGTPQRALDLSDGSVDWSASYDDYGSLTSSSGSLTQPWRFPGQYADPETGLYYNNQRYYIPWVGHYAGMDPIGYQSGLNLINYCGANPSNCSDLTGLDFYISLDGKSVGSELTPTYKENAEMCAELSTATNANLFEVAGYSALGFINQFMYTLNTREGIDDQFRALLLLLALYSNHVGGPANIGSPYKIPSSSKICSGELSALETGKSPNVRLVGSEAELNSLYQKLSYGGELNTPPTYNGSMVKLPDGTLVGIRNNSTSGGATIDISYPSGNTGKVHIAP